MTCRVCGCMSHKVMIHSLINPSVIRLPPALLIISCIVSTFLYFQDVSPGLLLSCWSHTISSSLAGTYDHRQSTAGVVGLLAHAMLINKSQVRTCLIYYYDYLRLGLTIHDFPLLSKYHPHLLHVSESNYLCSGQHTREERTHPIHSFYPLSFLFSLFLLPISISHIFFSPPNHFIFHDL